MKEEIGLVYHYTSLETLKCIFEEYSKDNPCVTFWASNCTFMNDPHEIVEGIKLVREILDKQLPAIHKNKAKIILSNTTKDLKDFLLLGTTSGQSDIPYAISFSPNSDNLNMWRMYGDSGRGIALGFDMRKLRVSGAKLIKCIYTQDEEITEYISDVINEFTTLYEALGEPPSFLTSEDYAEIMSLGPICYYVSKVKNSCYKYEDEYRLTKDCRTPKFRVVNGIMIPYVEMKIHIDALQSIIIGPDCDERNENSLKLFFASKGLRRIEDSICRSKVPYRN